MENPFGFNERLGFSPCRTPVVDIPYMGYDYSTRKTNDQLYYVFRQNKATSIQCHHQRARLGMLGNHADEMALSAELLPAHCVFSAVPQRQTGWVETGLRKPLLGISI